MEKALNNGFLILPFSEMKKRFDIAISPQQIKDFKTVADILTVIP